MLIRPLTTQFATTYRNVVNPTESQAKGQRDENSYAVRNFGCMPWAAADGAGSGLDNAGKTTIVKKVMGEDVNTVSPTLGFIIKTIDFQGEVR